MPEILRLSKPTPQCYIFVGIDNTVGLLLVHLPAVCYHRACGLAVCAPFQLQGRGFECVVSFGHRGVQHAPSCPSLFSHPFILHCFTQGPASENNPKTTGGIVWPVDNLLTCSLCCFQFSSFVCDKYPPFWGALLFGHLWSLLLK